MDYRVKVEGLNTFEVSGVAVISINDDCYFFYNENSELIYSSPVSKILFICKKENFVK